MLKVEGMLEMNFFELFQKVAKPVKMKRQSKKIMGDNQIRSPPGSFLPHPVPY